MAEDKQKIDSDILKGRQDILRAKKAAEQKTAVPKTIEPKAAAPAKPTPLMAAVVANKVKTERKDEHIPSFNVAERILSDQRKASSEKRKSPNQKPAETPPSPPTPERLPLNIPAAPAATTVFSVKREYIDALSLSQPVNSIQSTIISEIVARDIKNFCLGKPALM